MLWFWIAVNSLCTDGLDDATKLRLPSIRHRKPLGINVVNLELLYAAVKYTGNRGALFFTISSSVKLLVAPHNRISSSLGHALDTSSYRVASVCTQADPAAFGNIVDHHPNKRRCCIHSVAVADQQGSTCRRLDNRLPYRRQQRLTSRWSSQEQPHV